MIIIVRKESISFKVITFVVFSLNTIFAFSQINDIKGIVNNTLLKDSTYVNIDSIANAIDKKIVLFVFRNDKCYNCKDSSSIDPLHEIIRNNVSTSKFISVYSYQPPFKGLHYRVHLRLGNEDLYPIIKPPLFYIKIKDSALIKAFAQAYSLNISEYDSTYVLSSYNEEKIIYEQLNEIIAGSSILSLLYTQLDHRSISNQIGGTDKLIYFQLNYLLSKPSLFNSVDKENFRVDNSSNVSFDFRYTSFPFKNKSQIGIGFQFAYNNYNLNITGLKDIVDTLPYKYIDKDGDNFIRIIFTNNIKEKVSFKTIETTPFLSFCENFKVNNKTLYVTFSTGLCITNIVSSYYQGVNGVISYGGLYPQYSKDTIFSNTMEFPSNVNIDPSKQTLSLRPTSLALRFSLQTYYLINRKLGIVAGFNKTQGITPFIATTSNNEFISNYLGNYNSLLYRRKKKVVDNTNFSLGLIYKL